jgi:transposase-like protein
MSEQRAVPFYCPFCGEEDLFPAEDTHGSWHCHGCTRVFSLRLAGLRSPGTAEPPGGVAR